MPVQEQKRRQRLSLRGCGDALPHGDGRQELGDFLLAQQPRIPKPMKAHKSLDPRHVRGLRARSPCAVSVRGLPARTQPAQPHPLANCSNQRILPFLAGGLNERGAGQHVSNEHPTNPSSGIIRAARVSFHFAEPQRTPFASAAICATCSSCVRCVVSMTMASGARRVCVASFSSRLVSRSVSAASSSTLGRRSSC